MKKKLHIPIKLKFTFVIAFIMALMLLFINYYLPNIYEERQKESIQKQAQIMADNFSDQLAKGLNFEKTKLIVSSAENLLTNDKIIYLIIKKENTLFYEYNIYLADLIDYQNNIESNFSSKWKILNNHSSVMFKNEIIGDVYVGYSVKEFYAKADEIRDQIIKVSILLLFIATILVFIVNSVFLNPLKKIIKVIKIFSKGDLVSRADVESKDELEIMAKSFNQMAEKIASSNKAIELFKSELESKVKDRTKNYKSELEILTRENNDLKGVELSISKSLSEKEVLLKEIHHRVKNNLQIVSSLFFFQSKKFKDPLTLGMFRDGQNRVKTMALIHEKLYQSDDLANIDFKEYIKKLANFLLQSYSENQGRIKLKINVSEVELGVDTAVPCGLIINELISNSFKHGFNEGDHGEIRIDMRYNEKNKLVLQISDSGKGMSKDFKIEQSDSLGLRLVNNLATQLNGHVEFFNNNGTLVKLTFANPNLKT